MSERFKKLKRKYLLSAILKSVVCGLSFGLFAVGIALLALKLSAISLDVIWYILIGIGAVVLGCVVSFVFFRPTDKKVATKLDNEYSLEERVQTSLEYNGQEGTIIELQRVDTDEKLQSLPKQKIRFSRIWQYCATAAVAIAIAVTAFAIPAKSATAQGNNGGDVNDIPAEVDQLDLDFVRDIIKDVNRSELNATVKSGIVAELEYLVVELEDAVAGNMMQKDLEAAVKNTIEGVDFVVNSANSFEEIAAAIETETQPYLAQSVLRGGNSYRASSIMNYDDILRYQDRQPDATREKIEVGLKALLDSFETLGLDELPDALLNIFVPLSNLPASGFNNNDKLYSYLSSFSSEITILYSEVDGGEYTEAQEVKDKVEEYVGNLKILITEELVSQSYAGAMRRFVGNRLRNIFGLGDYEEAEADGGTVSGGKPTTDPDDPIVDGQIPGGGGGTQYGSDQEIYDPFTGQYAKIEDIYDRYSDMLQEWIEAGNLTPEQEKMARDYFDWLRGTLKDEK